MVVISVLHSTCDILEKLEIPYMLSGSLAMSVYSVARSTRDIDLVVELLETDVDRLLAEFHHHYSHRPSIIEEIKRGGMFISLTNKRAIN